MTRTAPIPIRPMHAEAGVLPRRRLLLGLPLLLAACAEPYRTPGDGPRGGRQPVAVLDVEGSVEVRREGRSFRGTDGMPLYRDDEVRTTGSSYALVRFADGDRVWLDYDTLVRIGSVFAVFGRVFAAVSGVFEVDSEFVTASSEGTEFTVTIGRAGRNTFSVAVRSGAVLCRPQRGRWRPVRLIASQRLRGQVQSTPVADRLDAREQQAEFDWVPALRRGPERFDPRPTPPDSRTDPQTAPPRPPQTRPGETPAVPRREGAPIERRPQGDPVIR